MTNKDDLMDKIVSLCKRRGFVFPGSEIYGGLANSWDYGPLGAQLKNNIKAWWWKKFVEDRTDMVGLDSSLLANTKVWQASGHLKEFSDPLVECRKCHERFRADLSENCPACGGRDITDEQQFNLMFKTYFGPVENDDNLVYLRPETAQGIFINFKNILDSSRVKIPFGVGQIGKAFRNEITPGNFIFRTREFEQMEIEYFIVEEDWQKHFEAWRSSLVNWFSELGIKSDQLHELEVPDGERAHYSKRTIDFEYDFPFGRKELAGLAFRGDFDLKQHQEFSGQNLSYTNENGAKFLPQVIEPSLGVDRLLLAVLCSAYSEEEIGDGETRVVLRLPFKLAPIKIAVFPLLKNKPQLVEKAREIYDNLKTDFTCEFDDNGNIGKRYRRQDEIGTPFCLTIDFDSLDNDDVTVRGRDNMEQERIKIDELIKYLKNKIN